jgi:hypothetical protein
VTVARPAPRLDGSARTVTEWLRGFSDSELVAVLRRRPDLALPAPTDLATLASRAGVRTSISRALDQLDAFTLRVLEVIAASGEPADRGEVAGWFAVEDRADVENAISRLAGWLLVWPHPDGLNPIGAVREVLGPYPVGLGRPAATLFGTVSDVTLAPLLRRLGLAPAIQPRSGAAVAQTVTGQLDALLADCDDAELAVLQRLSTSSPIGTLRSASNPDATPWQSKAVPPARSLVERGLLVPVDRDIVELPREVGLAVRQRPAGPVRPEPEAVTLIERGPVLIDSGATAAVLESVRLTELLLHAIANDPPAQLRAGGLGIRELRRLSKTIDAPESSTGLLLEVAFEAGLLSTSSGPEVSYLPTTDFDGWLTASVAARWVVLGAAWVAMTRLPSMIGARDERDRTIAALSGEAERHSAPALRLQLLRSLADLAPGTAPGSAEELLSRLSWRAPRRAAANHAAATAMLAEAAELGLTGYGAITSYARALLDNAETAAPRALTNATDLLDAALPAQVSAFLLQPDLTAVVPGPPTADLQRELALTADLESSGGASVYRLSPQSLRRALDAGRSGSDLREFFSSHSSTPVPQALDYLINDVATQHGRLRVGAVTSYLRADDESLLSRVLIEPSLADLGLQRIAPTVIISSAAIAVVMDRLRATGFAPAAESADGALVNLTSTQPRLPARQHSRLARVAQSSIGEAQLADVIARIRASERLAQAINSSTQRVAQQVPGVTSASILELLRTAVRESRTIAVSYVDDTGTPSQRTLQPISLGGGVVRGHHPEDDRLRSYPLQRITSVTVLQE